LAESITSSIFGIVQVKMLVNTEFSESEIAVRFIGEPGQIYIGLLTAFLIEQYGSDNIEVQWKKLEHPSGDCYAHRFPNLYRDSQRS
jgi:hypothetical protein